MLRKLPRTPKQSLRRTIEEAEDDFSTVSLSIESAQLGLGIEEIDLAGATLHEERDHRPGPWLHARNPGIQVERLSRLRNGLDVGEQPVLPEQTGERDATDAL